MRGKIGAAIFAIYFLLTVVIVIILMALFRKKNRSIRKVWGKFQKLFLRYHLIENGKLDEEAQLLLINHKSMLDIIILEERHPKDIAWVAKKEIGQIPLIGQILKLPKMISVDRGNSRSLPKFLKDVEDRVKNGRVVAIFPEGTRSKGDRLLKFHSGAKIIAQKLNLKVQPIVLYDTSAIMNEKTFCVKFGQDVSATYLPVVDISEQEWFEKTREEMQKIYDREKERFANGYYKKVDA